MKQGIHPNYQKAKVVCVSCGHEFETGSVLKEIRVDTCSKCHPFYTGEQIIVQLIFINFLFLLEQHVC